MLGIVFQGAFRYLFFILHQPLAGGAWSAQLPFPMQHLGPPPTWSYSNSFHPHFLKSPFSAAQFTPRNTIPWGPGRLGSQAWHQERIPAVGEKGKSIPPHRAMESSCVLGKQRQPQQCQQVTSGNVGTVPGPWLGCQQPLMSFAWKEEAGQGQLPGGRRVLS